MALPYVPTEKQWDVFAAVQSQQWSQREVAAMFNIGQSQVSKWCRKVGEWVKRSKLCSGASVAEQAFDAATETAAHLARIARGLEAAFLPQDLRASVESKPSDSTPLGQDSENDSGINLEESPDDKGNDSTPNSEHVNRTSEAKKVAGQPPQAAESRGARGLRERGREARPDYRHMKQAAEAWLKREEALNRAAQAQPGALAALEKNPRFVEDRTVLQAIEECEELAERYADQGLTPPVLDEKEVAAHVREQFRRQHPPRESACFRYLPSQWQEVACAVDRPVGEYEAPLSGGRPAENLSGGREPAEDSRLTPAAQGDNSRLTPAAQGKKAAQEERRYDESFDDANPKPVTYKQLVDSIARDKGKPLIDGKWSSPEHQRYILECNARNWLFEDEPMGIVFKTAEAAMKYVLKLVVPMARQLPDGSLEYRYTILGEKWENPFDLPTMDDAVYTPEETFTLGAADGLASIAHEAKYKWELQLKGKYPLPPEGWFDDWTCMTDAGTKPRPPVEAPPPPDYPLPKPNMTEQEEREWLLLYLRAHGKDVDESIFDDPPEEQEEKEESPPPEKPEKKKRTYAQQADYTGKNGFSSKRQKQPPKSPYPPIVWHSLR